MIEGGFVQKWLSEVKEKTKLLEVSQEGKSEDTLIDLPKLQGGFVVLGIGIGFGILVLLVELWYWKCIIIKKPTFNKYHLDQFFKNNAIRI